jgi:hypothetical protein
MVGASKPAVVHVPDRSSCRAVMLTCIDHRFLRPACDFLEREGLLGSTDVIAWPGGAMALLSEDAEVLLSAMELAFTLHAPLTVLLIAHLDCGRLGGSGRFDGIERETSHLAAGLQDAAVTVRSRFPDTQIRLVRLSDRGASDVPLPLLPVGEETLLDLDPPFPRTWEDAR